MHDFFHKKSLKIHYHTFICILFVPPKKKMALLLLMTPISPRNPDGTPTYSLNAKILWPQTCASRPKRANESWNNPGRFTGKLPPPKTNEWQWKNKTTISRCIPLLFLKTIFQLVTLVFWEVFEEYWMHSPYILVLHGSFTNLLGICAIYFDLKETWIPKTDGPWKRGPLSSFKV